MSLLRNAIRCHLTTRYFKPSHARFLFLRQSGNLFSTDAEQPPPADDSIIDPFLQETHKGLIYGNLIGVTKNTLKTDVITLLEGCNLTPDDIKINYNKNFMPIGMTIQFSTRRAYDLAFRVITRKGRLYRLEMGDRTQWDILMPYDGKTVILHGIPQPATMDDVDRFLSGCDYDASSLQFLSRMGLPETIKRAMVRFHSRAGAMNTFITKNRGYCLNSKVSVRVLE